MPWSQDRESSSWNWTGSFLSAGQPSEFQKVLYRLLRQSCLIKSYSAVDPLFKVSLLVQCVRFGMGVSNHSLIWIWCRIPKRKFTSGAVDPVKSLWLVRAFEKVSTGLFLFLLNGHDVPT